MASSPIPVLLITAALGAAAIGFAASLLDASEGPIQAGGHPLSADGEPSGLQVTNRGVHVMHGDVHVKITVDGAAYVVGQAALQRALGDEWRRGEALCIVGTDDDCLTTAGQHVTAEIQVGPQPAGTFRWEARR